MRLIGSKLEQDYREELKASRAFHFSASSQSRLKEVLQSAGYSVGNALVLHWTPDQSEDFYTVLIEGAFLATVRIDRSDAGDTPSIDRYELQDYLRGLSRVYQVQLLVAQDLVKAIP
jgi:hypothetical protein